jgi:hypothetical protein
LEAATVQVDIDGDVSTMCRILQSFVPGASLSRTQVQSLLFLIACVILTFDLTAMCYGKAAGPLFGLYPVAYYAILAVSLSLAVVGLAIAFLLSCSDGLRFLALAKPLLPFAFMLFLVTAVTWVVSRSRSCHPRFSPSAKHACSTPRTCTCAIIVVFHVKKSIYLYSQSSVQY